METSRIYRHPWGSNKWHIVRENVPPSWDGQPWRVAVFAGRRANGEEPAYCGRDVSLRVASPWTRLHEDDEPEDVCGNCLRGRYADDDVDD